MTEQAALFDATGAPTLDADAPPCCNCGADVEPDYVIPERARHSQLCRACVRKGADETRARYLAEKARRAAMTPAQVEARELIAQAKSLTNSAGFCSMDTARELTAQAQALTAQARKLDPDATL